MELHEIEELRTLVARRLLLNQLKPRGIGSVVFGAITMAVGATAISINPINGLLAALGLFLFVEGIWLLVKPSHTGFIVDGVALLAIGVWNMLIAFADMADDNGGGRWLILAGFQILWGIQSFGKASRAGEALSVTVSKDAADRAEAIIRTIYKSNYKINPNFIQFSQKNFTVDQLWKGVLLEDVAVLVGVKTQQSIVANKADLAIIQKGDTKPGKPVKADLKAGDKQIAVVIPAETMSRIQAWNPQVLSSPLMR